MRGTRRLCIGFSRRCGQTHCGVLRGPSQEVAVRLVPHRGYATICRPRTATSQRPTLGKEQDPSRRFQRCLLSGVEARLRSPTVKSSPRIYGPTSLSSSMPRAAQSCSKFERDRSWIRRPLLQALCDAHDAGFNLIGCPQAPLIDKRVILGACRPQRRARIGLGEIHVDRERLPEDEAIILQARNMSVGWRYSADWLSVYGRTGMCSYGMPISSSIHNERLARDRV